VARQPATATVPREQVFAEPVCVIRLFPPRTRWRINLADIAAAFVCFGVRNGNQARICQIGSGAPTHFTANFREWSLPLKEQTVAIGAQHVGRNLPGSWRHASHGLHTNGGAAVAIIGKKTTMLEQSVAMER
jgi:hypothetical protein